jgi:hypothetical protein
VKAPNSQEKEDYSRKKQASPQDVASVQSDCKKPTLPLKYNTPAGFTSQSKAGVDG